MMESLKDFIKSDTGHIISSTILYLVTVIIVFLLYRWILKILRRRAAKTKSSVDDFVIDLLRIPVLWLLFWITFEIFTAYSFISKTHYYNLLSQISNILLILTVGWILIKIVRVVFYHFEHKLDVNLSNNIHARTGLTKMKIFEGLIVAIITVVTIAVCLMTFDKIRTLGISLLTSAGIAGIIAGIAAQKSLGDVFAGIQIALTQPIRINDMVVVDGQSGKIEEINLTYVVVRIWDDKRLILPITYFMEKSFQNMTRNSDNTTGTVFLYLDYKVPVDELRKKLKNILKDTPKWDKRIANVQVTGSKENYMELRIALSSNNPDDNADLCVEVREKMISYINNEYPDCFPKIRIHDPVAIESPSISN